MRSARWGTIRGGGISPDPAPGARPSPALAEFVTQLGMEPDTDPLVEVLALSAALNDAFSYTPGATSVDSPIDDILVSRKGVCQDYTHVLVAVARSWGIPTRYVSGHLYVTANETQATAGSASRSSASHAWARMPPSRSRAG